MVNKEPIMRLDESSLSDEKLSKIGIILRDFEKNLIDYSTVINRLKSNGYILIGVALSREKNYKLKEDQEQYNERLKEGKYLCNDIGAFIIRDEYQHEYSINYGRKILEAMARQGDEEAYKSLCVILSWEKAHGATFFDGWELIDGVWEQKKIETIKENERTR